MFNNLLYSHPNLDAVQYIEVNRDNTKDTTQVKHTDSNKDNTLYHKHIKLR